MARGHPDWGIHTDAFGSHELDIAELAARLGSPYTFFRTGKVIFTDDFHSSHKQWRARTDGAGGSIERVDGTAFFGDGSLMITPANVAGNYQLAERYVPLIGEGNAGLELLLWMTSEKNKVWLDLYVVPDDGGRALRVQIDAESGIVSYRNSAGDYETVFTLNTAYSAINPIWLILKLVVNIEDEKYERLYCNNEVKDLSGLSAPVAMSVWPSMFRVAITAFDTDGAQAPIYVDGIVFTIDEP